MRVPPVFAILGWGSNYGSLRFAYILRCCFAFAPIFHLSLSLLFLIVRPCAYIHSFYCITVTRFIVHSTYFVLYHNCPRLVVLSSSGLILVVPSGINILILATTSYILARKESTTFGPRTDRNLPEHSRSTFKPIKRYPWSSASTILSFKSSHKRLDSLDDTSRCNSRHRSYWLRPSPSHRLTW